MACPAVGRRVVLLEPLLGAGLHGQVLIVERVLRELLRRARASLATLVESIPAALLTIDR